ncbi:MAG: hypothetical protein LBT08_03080, partial [Synergistaceae bacterium]|nr:hypothetical protein [Synergistaceae bacterium]
MKKILVVSLAIVIVALASFAVLAAPAQLKFSTAGPRTSTWHEGAEKFASFIRERTGGRYEITIYPSDELSGGNQAAGIELVQTGVTDIHLQDALVWSSIARKAIVPCFPWLLP